jgi:hypothetical protein
MIGILRQLLAAILSFAITIPACAVMLDEVGNRTQNYNVNGVHREIIPGSRYRRGACDRQGARSRPIPFDILAGTNC